MPTCFVSLLLRDCLVFYCRFCAESEELYPPGEEPPGLIPFLTTQPSTPPIQSATSPTQPSTPPPSSHHHHSNSLQPLLNQPDLSPHCQTDDDDISIGKRVGTNLDFGGISPYFLLKYGTSFDSSNIQVQKLSNFAVDRDSKPVPTQKDREETGYFRYNTGKILGCKLLNSFQLPSDF